MAHRVVCHSPQGHPARAHHVSQPNAAFTAVRGATPWSPTGQRLQAIDRAALHASAAQAHAVQAQQAAQVVQAQTQLQAQMLAAQLHAQSQAHAHTAAMSQMQPSHTPSAVQAQLSHAPVTQNPAQAPVHSPVHATMLVQTPVQDQRHPSHQPLKPLQLTPVQQPQVVRQNSQPSREPVAEVPVLTQLPRLSRLSGGSCSNTTPGGRSYAPVHVETLSTASETSRAVASPCVKAEPLPGPLPGPTAVTAEVHCAVTPVSLPPEEDASSQAAESALGSELESSRISRSAVVSKAGAALAFEASTEGFKLENEEWGLRVRRSSTRVLEDALCLDTFEWLQVAVERAQEAGVYGDLLQKAQQELRRRQSIQDAEEALCAALQSATKASDTGALTKAISDARQADVSPDLLRFAQRRLEHIEEYVRRRQVNTQAEATLLDLVFGGADAVSLGVALEAALDAGVCRKVLDGAWKKKMDLEVQSSEIKRAARLSEGVASSTAPSEVVARNADAWSERDLASPKDKPDEKPASERSSRRSWGVERPNGGLPSPSRPPLRAHSATVPVATVASMGDDSAAASRRKSQAPTPCESPASVDCRTTRTPLKDASKAATDANAEETQSAGDASARSAPTVPCARSNSWVSSPPPRSTKPPGRSSSWASPRSPTEKSPIYGLDVELQARAASKYDRLAEDEAAAWIQAITGENVSGDFAGALRSGQVLCQLINTIRPGTIAKINGPGMPFKERENISNFLRACRSFGVQEYMLFSTDDLYEEKNLHSVVKCIHACGGALRRSVPEFHGPHLGVADTSNAKRDLRRDLRSASQTSGLHGAMERSHLDVVSGQIVRGGC
eukprot:TRINITY_DN25044_c0_g10_i1.p1 TRINITY_DN25044_c0_g10~~TRINITY_DN25044_c0_g10_i1.p1  ORF type:complete len:844 (-),score=182.94 TRINITY_DN25044_c0_g10_i1:136-2667(-)